MWEIPIHYKLYIYLYIITIIIIIKRVLKIVSKASTSINFNIVMTFIPFMYNSNIYSYVIKLLIKYMSGTTWYNVFFSIYSNFTILKYFDGKFTRFLRGLDFDDGRQPVFERVASLLCNLADDGSARTVIRRRQLVMPSSSAAAAADERPTSTTIPHGPPKARETVSATVVHADVVHPPVHPSPSSSSSLSDRASFAAHCRRSVVVVVVVRRKHCCRPVVRL